MWVLYHLVEETLLMFEGELMSVEGSSNNFAAIYPIIIERRSITKIAIPLPMGVATIVYQWE
jgi:hypothetical protein